MRLLTFALICAPLLAQLRPAPSWDGSVANLPAQKIGPSDLVAIQIYDAPELTRTARVGTDGLIRLPMLKQRVKADGLMPSELEAAIAQALQQEGLIVDPYVTVTVAEYNSRPISVAGADTRMSPVPVGEGPATTSVPPDTVVPPAA